MDEREESLVYTLQALRDAVREDGELPISILSVGSLAADQALYELRDELAEQQKKRQDLENECQELLEDLEKSESLRISYEEQLGDAEQLWEEVLEDHRQLKYECRDIVESTAGNCCEDCVAEVHNLGLDLEDKLRALRKKAAGLCALLRVEDEVTAAMKE